MYQNTQDHDNWELLKRRARDEYQVELQSGRITKLPCILCGDPQSHGHHPNYRKPYHVVWLCPKHHGWQHRNRHGVRFVGQYSLVTEAPAFWKAVTWHNSRVRLYLETAQSDTFGKRKDATLDYAAIAMVAAWEASHDAI